MRVLHWAVANYKRYLSEGAHPVYAREYLYDMVDGFLYFYLNPDDEINNHKI